MLHPKTLCIGFKGLNNLWIMPSREFVLFPSQYRMNWMLSQIPTLFTKSKPKHCIAHLHLKYAALMQKKKALLNLPAEVRILDTVPSDKPSHLPCHVSVRTLTPH